MHIPVLINESISSINPRNGDIIIDATFGGGGHTKKILDTADCAVHAIDNDISAISRANEMQEVYNKNRNKTRLYFYNTNFANLVDILPKNIKFNGILFDFGVSSFQLDQADRGFSFMRDGPLDMRMNCVNNTLTAEHIVNSYTEHELAQVIYNYGDEIMARKIAKLIVDTRNNLPNKKLSTTHQLRDVIHRAYGVKSINKKIDSATKTFQAIRIHVNDELRSIHTALDSLQYVLSDNANIVTISFHSLEDRIVKNWALSHKTQENNNFTIEQIGNVVKPKTSEISANPRSRSAVMRHYMIHFN